MDKDWISKFNAGIKKLNETLLEKKFKISNEKGYDPEDVDGFFDEVIGYFDEVKTLVENKYLENIKFKEEITQLRNEIAVSNTVNKKLRDDIDLLKMSGYGHYTGSKPAEKTEENKKDEK